MTDRAPPSGSELTALEYSRTQCSSLDSPFAARVHGNRIPFQHPAVVESGANASGSSLVKTIGSSSVPTARMRPRTSSPWKPSNSTRAPGATESVTPSATVTPVTTRTVSADQTVSVTISPPTSMLERRPVAARKASPGIVACRSARASRAEPRAPATRAEPCAPASQAEPGPLTTAPSPGGKTRHP